MRGSGPRGIIYLTAARQRTSACINATTKKFGTYTRTLPPGTPCRWIRVGLENGQQNGGTNYYITMAEARAWSGSTNVLLAAAGPPVPVTNNLASFKPSYMLRLASTQAGATNANDDNYSTEAKTTTQTVDGYWETDLGSTYAIYSVRSIADFKAP